MPKEEELALRKEVKKKGLKGKKAKAYIYGTMEKQGWRPRRPKSKKKGIK